MKNTKNHSQATGPRTPEGKKIASQNSMKHGLLSRVLIFKDDIEAEEYRKLEEGLFDSLRPTDQLEKILVEDIAVCYWKLRVSLRWEEQELCNRENRNINQTIHHFIGKSEGAKMPLLRIGTASLGAGSDDSPSSAGWECKEMVLRVANDEREQSDGGEIVAGDAIRNVDSNTERYAMELRVADPMDTILRYDTKIRRDLYRAIEHLNRIRELKRSKKG